MICPHCSTKVKFDWYSSDPFDFDEVTEKAKQMKFANCLNCSSLVAMIVGGDLQTSEYRTEGYIPEHEWTDIIYPKKSSFLNSDEIPKKYTNDHQEAVSVISVSPKASAALSRRLLQNILRDEFKIQKRTLSQEIEAFIELPGIPTHLTDAVDAIRNIGNLAAHPTKDQSTGEIVDIEPGEAEWLIEVIEALFDFTFVQPVKLQRRRKQLNSKLEKLGKPPMKQK